QARQAVTNLDFSFAPSFGTVSTGRAELSSLREAHRDAIRNPAGENSGLRSWYDHYVVVKDGRVFDNLTGPQGQTIAEYQARWELADVIDFGF
ncbi:MAG: hypothetical protein ABUL60_24510, partial [Myxococcales bacterium]